jgi:hypothetical protein
MYYTVLKAQKFIPCDVMEVPETHKRERVSIAIKKGSPYRKIFNYKYVFLLRQQMKHVSPMSQTCWGTSFPDPGAFWYLSAPLDKCQGLSQFGHYPIISNSVIYAYK